MEEVLIIDIVRTAIGKYGGKLAGTRPDDLLAHTFKAIVERTQIPPKAIEEVFAGAANQAGEDNRNVARMAVLLAQLPEEIGGVTVNRLCASGLEAIIQASRAIQVGDGEVYLAGGVESMTRAPWVMAKSAEPWSRKPEVFDTTMGWRFTNPALARLHYPYAMGETAENVAERYQISRQDQDTFAWQSQHRYQVAAAANKFESEIVPVPIGGTVDQPEWFQQDEHPRQTTAEKLGTLAPVFRKGGTVTAGNSSGINDGAACALLASSRAAARLGLTPLVRVVGMASAGVDPAYMGIGPVPAIRKLLAKTGISLEEIDLYELNEAFAAQALACIRELKLPEEKVNVNGGAIALGHPLGCSGVRISATLIHEMKRRKAKYGLAAMCVGVGQGVAILYENASR